MTAIARALGGNKQAIYGWRRQEQIARRLKLGLSSAEMTKLAPAKEQIREREAEVAVHRCAAELSNDLHRYP